MTPDDTPRRRLVPIASRAGAGEMATIAFGPATRPIDILLLHANGFNAMTYRQLLAPLGAQGLHVMAADQRGHGRSRLSTDIAGHDWQRYADDLLELIATLDAPPKVLAGHSLGATTILLAAPALPDPAPSLVLFDPVLPPAGGDAAALVATAVDSPLVRGALHRNARFESRQAALDSYRGRGAFRTWPDAVIADYLEDGLVPFDTDDGLTLACAPAWEAANFRTSYLLAPTEALARPRAPVRILRAAKDSTCRWDEGVDAPPWPAGILVERVPETSHFLPMERPEHARDALRAALGLPAGPG